MDHLFTRIYALAVCFVTVICITISTGMALYDVVKIINPALTLSPYQYQHLQSNEAYRQNRFPHMFNARIAMVNGLAMHSGQSISAVPNQQAVEPLSDEEITRLRTQQYDLVMSNERRQATASLIRLAIILLVSGPLFFIHWKLSQKYETV